MQRCPYCEKPNQPSSTFCIHCGEPTDEHSVREFASALSTVSTVPAKSPPVRSLSSGAPGAFPTWLLSGRLFSAGRGAEFVAGAAILLGIVGFALYSAFQQNAQSEHYAHARQATLAHHYEQALEEYIAASGYMDTPQRSAEVRNQLASRDMLYAQAMADRKVGKSWQAAVALSKASAIDASYRDIPQQLADVRLLNGLILYKQATWVNGTRKSGLFFAWADGGEPHQLPHTDASSTIHAVSPDSRWVVYSTDISSDPQGGPGIVFLYDLKADILYPMSLPVLAFTTPLAARFSSDSRQVWLDMSGGIFSYPLPLAGDGPRTLNPQPPDRAEIARLHGMSLLISRDTDRHTDTLTLSADSSTGATSRLVSVEQGQVDGAIFSGDSRFLLYRVWSAPDDAPNPTCRLVLVDLTLQELHAVTIASLPLRASDERRSSLKGEFTRDGRHVLLVQRYRGDTEVHIYTPGMSNSRSLSDTASDKLALALSKQPTIPQAVLGLSSWAGFNSLASSQGSVPVVEDQGDRAKRYITFGYWVSVTPNDMYVLYLDGAVKADTPGSPGKRLDFPLAADISTQGYATGSSYSLYAAPFRAVHDSTTAEVDTRLVLRTSQSPLDWLALAYMLPDGQTLLSTVPLAADATPGLYSYDLQTGKSILAMSGITGLWRPGYSSLRPDLPR